MDSTFLSSIIFFLGVISFSNAQKSRTVTIIPSDSNVAKLEGERYLVSCRSHDRQPVVWKNPRNKEITSSEMSRIRTEANVGLELYFADIKMEDAGTYLCISRTGRAGINLTVVRPIAFEQSYATQSAVEGRDFVMKCKARGHTPTTRITWKIDQRPPQGRFSQGQDGNLIIRRVTESDARHKYICRATDLNPALSDTKDFLITLKVKMKPKLQGQPRKNMYGVDGQWANLTCSVIAEPPARFEWYFGNKKLSTGNEILFFNQSTNVNMLQIVIRRGADFGDYTCKAINSMGYINQTLTLKRGKKPKPPVLSILTVGKDGVAVRVRNPPAGPVKSSTSDRRYVKAEDLKVIGYSVQYKLLKRDTWVTAHNITQTSYGFIVWNLVPNVTYFIRAAARNLATTGDYSSELKVITTSPNIPFTPPLNTGNTKYDTISSRIYRAAAIFTLMAFVQL